MRITRKAISLILAFVMVLGLLPATVSAAEAEDCVYLSISFDGKYIDDKDGDPIVYLPISLEDIAAVDLTEYGLDNMLFDADQDGTYETTALQLLIYAHEELYGGKWSDVSFAALPGSSYFSGGIFGFTENLVYFLNGDFPVDESQASDYMTTGATSDRIVLEAGDFLDVASFECYSFLWDTAGGFHLFADEEGNYVHDYTVAEGETLSVKLMHSFCDLMFGQSWVKDATDYEVYYGASFGEGEGSVTTDDSGCAEIAFPTAGTYYVWCDGDNSEDYSTHGSCDYCLETGEPCIVSAPAYAKVTVTAAQTPEQPDTPDTPVVPDPPSQAQDVSAVLNATMAKLAQTVTAPTFGTNAGEWTVFSLARGNHFAKDSDYFADYYDRIVETVNTTAASVNMNGALDKNKSTENSRLIMALSAIGKDATSVGNWDLVEAYSENGINWIKKQGMNGTIWTLIALDSHDYATSDSTIRQQCVDSILSLQHEDGGWSLVNTNLALTSNVDVTGMVLTALYPYRDQEGVFPACMKAINWLSQAQLATGGFPYGAGETSESCSWAIVGLTTWGINPDTDSRFVKNGNSAVDNLLSYYLADSQTFEHGKGAGSNPMATDQCCYALVAYDRFLNGDTALFDYSDVEIDEPIEPEDPEVPEDPEDPENPEDPEDPEDPADPEDPETEEVTATLGLPNEIKAGDSFNGVVTVDDWNNEAGYKLIDFIVNVPDGVSVTGVTPGSRLAGGEVSFHLEAETGKLRVVYFDANENTTLTITGEEFPAELFTIGFKADGVTGGSKLNIAISGMSLKYNSDSSNEASMAIVDTDTAKGTVDVVSGVSFSAVCLYEGDDVDLIPSTKKAVAVAITGIAGGSKLTFRNGETEVVFLYSQEVTAKTGVATYVALVDAAIEMEKFIDAKNFTIGAASQDAITFGDINSDGIVNAQDALAAVDTWLRKGEEPTDLQILTTNVNGDSRINTFDALGIVEAFVNDSTYGVVTKAATITTRQ